MKTTLSILLTGLLLATQAFADAPSPSPTASAPAPQVNECRTGPMQACNSCAAACPADRTPVCKPAHEQCKNGQCTCLRQPSCQCQPAAPSAKPG